MKWKPVCRGSVGLELHGWRGFEFGRDLWHRYAMLGLATVYVSAHPLVSLLATYRAVRAELRGGRK